MKRHDDMQGRLNDLIDGALSPAERASVMEHVDACDHCRAELEGLAALQAETQALPREIAPPRDLWSGIEGRLQARSAPARYAAPDPVIVVDFDAAARRRASVVRRWAPLAAAAVMLVTLSSGITAYLMRARQAAPVAVVTVPVPAAQTSPRPTTALAAFRPTEVEYLGALESLQVELNARRGQLAPQTIATIEENLKIIDQAIGEARSALESDPSNAELPLLLSSVYQKKVELLQTALQLPARSL